MEYNIKLTREEIEYLLVLLSGEFCDCCKSCDWICELDDREIEDFRHAMKIGRLTERFVKLLERVDREEGQACTRK